MLLRNSLTKTASLRIVRYGWTAVLTIALLVGGLITYSICHAIYQPTTASSTTQGFYYLLSLGGILFLLAISIIWSMHLERGVKSKAAEIVNRETLLANLAVHVQEGIIRLDDEGRIIFFSPGMARLTGIQAKDAEGHFYWDIIQLSQPGEAHERAAGRNDQQSSARRMAEIRSEPEAKPFQAHILDCAGRLRTVIKTVHRMEVGGQKQWLLVFCDMTEPARAYDDLRASELKYQHLVENMPLGVYVRDSQSRFITCNQEYANIFGLFSPAQIVGNDLYSIYPRDIAEQIIGEDRFVMESRKPLVVERVITNAQGQKHDYLVSVAPIIDSDGQVIGVQGAMLDISERKRFEQKILESEQALQNKIVEHIEAQEKLRISEAQYHALFDTMSEGVALHETVYDESGQPIDYRYLKVNPAFEKKFGVSAQDIIGRTIRDIFPELDAWWFETYARVATSGNPARFERFVPGMGKYIEVAVFCPQEGQLASISEDITARRKTVEIANRTQFAVDQIDVEVYLAGENGTIIYANKTACDNLGLSADELIGMDMTAFARFAQPQATGWDLRDWPRFLSRLEARKNFWVVSIHSTVAGRKYPVELHLSYFEYESQRYCFAFAYDITSRKEAERTVSRVNHALRTVIECNQILMRADHENQLINDICRLIVEHGGYRFGWIGYAQTDERKTVTPVAHYGAELGYLETIDVVWSNEERGRGPVGTAIRSRRPVTVNFLNDDPIFHIWREEAIKRGFSSMVALPLVYGSETYGCLGIYAEQSNVFAPDEVKLLQGLADDLAFGIHVLRARVQQNAAELALRASEELLSTFVNNLPAATLVTDHTGRVLYQNDLMKQSAGGVSFVGKMPHEIFPSPVADKICHHNQLALETGFVQAVDSFQTPLGVKIFNSHHFLLSRQNLPPYIGIISVDITALKNAEHEIEQANEQFLVAYEGTLVGWSRALELRDYETSGHSRRVVDATIQLARAMGISEDELPHFRRGALLHDIGKMALPDSILTKPGRLTEQEWAIMRQHPGHAYSLLSCIPFLQKAMDIPYCHHERWDGSGYPRGLRGEAIPLPARIFAVVDVWDALLSNRPYRPAYSKPEVREFLMNESGKKLDPKVVQVFLQLDIDLERRMN